MITRAQMMGLSERQAWVIVKHHQQYPLTFKEMGRRMNVTPERVRQIYRNAMRQLALTLSQDNNLAGR